MSLVGRICKGEEEKPTGACYCLLYIDHLGYHVLILSSISEGVTHRRMSYIKNMGLTELEKLNEDCVLHGHVHVPLSFRKGFRLTLSTSRIQLTNLSACRTP